MADPQPHCRPMPRDSPRDSTALETESMDSPSAASPSAAVAAGLVESENSIWEQAYARFETPAEEIAKFTRRLRWLGAEAWPRDLRIAELFCGRGNGLQALAEMGFSNLWGVDLSESLLRQYQGTASCLVGDCRSLPLPDRSMDLLIVQGGLHHLQVLPDDLRRVLSECRRVLADDGRLAIVEPWLTPFLSLVHFGCRRSWARKAWPRLDALATMIEHEQETYFNWLSRPQELLELLEREFTSQKLQIGWGKLNFLGTKR